MVSRKERPAYGEGRQALIAAAIRLVAREGLTKLTYRSLAAEAGITSGAVQHHFGSLQDLLDSALEYSLERAREYGQRARTFAEFIDMVVDFLRKEPDAIRFQVELFVGARHRPELQEMVELNQDGYRKTTKETLRAMGLRHDDALIEFMMATVDGIIYQMVVFGDKQMHYAEQQFSILRQIITNYGTANH